MNCAAPKRSQASRDGRPVEWAAVVCGGRPGERCDFHAHRRAWARARKHLPLKDVAEAGGWRTTDTLLRCYTQTDEGTVVAVVSETRKVRAATKP